MRFLLRWNTKFERVAGRFGGTSLYEQPILRLITRLVKRRSNYCTLLSYTFHTLHQVCMCLCHSQRLSLQNFHPNVDEEPSPNKTTLIDINFIFSFLKVESQNEVF